MTPEQLAELVALDAALAPNWTAHRNPDNSWSVTSESRGVVHHPIGGMPEKFARQLVALRNGLHEAICALGPVVTEQLPAEPTPPTVGSEETDPPTQTAEPPPPDAPLR